MLIHLCIYSTQTAAMVTSIGITNTNIWPQQEAPPSLQNYSNQQFLFLLGYDTALLYTLPQNVGIQLTSNATSYFRRMESSYPHVTFPHICSLFYIPHVTALLLRASNRILHMEVYIHTHILATELLLSHILQCFFHVNILLFHL